MVPNRNILLVDDDSVDAMMVKRSFQDLKIRNPLVHVENGEEALAYLTQSKENLPCLILLDLNMPRMNGIEFLKTVKKSDVLRIIPIVVLTTSKGDEDRLESFKEGIAGYMIKQVEYEKFLDTVKQIDSYWTTSELPF